MMVLRGETRTLMMKRKGTKTIARYQVPACARILAQATARLAPKRNSHQVLICNLAVEYFQSPRSSDGPADSKDDGAGSIIPKLTKRKHPSNKGRGAKASKESKKRKLELIEQPAITNDTVPVREIRKYFAEHCQNPNNADFLARLYSAIGSQDAFLQQKNAAHHLRSNMVKIPFARTNSVVENMRSLDRLVSSFAASTIMERYLLVQLVDQRDALVEKHKPQQDRRLRMATENRSRLPRAEGLALVSMMDESYPMLDKSTEDYEIKLTTLRNRLSKGRNLHNLKEEFGREILALIPVDGTWQINDREYEFPDWRAK